MSQRDDAPSPLDDLRYLLDDKDGGIDEAWLTYKGHHALIKRLKAFAVSEIEPKFENVQDAPRTLRNTFTVQHDGKRADVVYASFAACIEREANSIRSTPNTGAEQRPSTAAAGETPRTWTRKEALMGAQSYLLRHPPDADGEHQNANAVIAAALIEAERELAEANERAAKAEL